MAAGGQRLPPTLTTTELQLIHGGIRRFIDHFSGDPQRRYGGPAEILGQWWSTVGLLVNHSQLIFIYILILKF